MHSLRVPGEDAFEELSRHALKDVGDDDKSLPGEDLESLIDLGQAESDDCAVGLDGFLFSKLLKDDMEFTVLDASPHLGVNGLSMGSDGGSVLEEIVESGIGSAMLVGYEVPD